jgi:hypothetical protein
MSDTLYGLRFQCLEFAKTLHATSNVDLLLATAETIYRFVTDQPVVKAEPKKAIAPDFPPGIVPYDYQTSLIKKILTHHRVVINKARQMGVTMTLSAAAAHLVRTRLDYTVVFIPGQYPHGLDTMDRIRALIPKEALAANNHRSCIELLNGSKIVARAATADWQQGLFPNMLIVDDVRDKLDFVLVNLKDTTAAVVAGSPLTEGFHKIWGAERWGQVLLPYFLHPERDENFVRNMKERIGKDAFRREFCCEFV